MNSQCFRRRALSVKDDRVLSLSTYEISGISPASGSTNVTVYFGDSVLKASSGVSITTSGQIRSATYSSSTGKITINYYSNYELEVVYGYMNVSYRGQTVAFTLIQDADYLIDEDYSIDYSTAHDFSRSASFTPSYTNGYCVKIEYTSKTLENGSYNYSNVIDHATNLGFYHYSDSSQVTYKYSKRKEYRTWASGNTESITNTGEFTGYVNRDAYGPSVSLKDIFSAAGITLDSSILENGTYNVSGEFSSYYPTGAPVVHLEYTLYNVSLTINDAHKSPSNVKIYISGSTKNWKAVLGIGSDKYYHNLDYSDSIDNFFLKLY